MNAFQDRAVPPNSRMVRQACAHLVMTTGQLHALRDWLDKAIKETEESPNGGG